MINKPIDTGRLGTIRCLIAPEPRVTLEGEQRRDREGNPLWITGLVVRQMEGRRLEEIHVVTNGQPQGLVEGGEVRVTDLWGNDWEIDGRNGTTYRAAAITPVQGSVGSSAPSPAAGPRGKPAGGDS
ncbi:hypothetical protein [Streptomyces alanosinicus]|uniref:Uncharacterized protein n=1 Tax=Streptomyces alanosinicus TaxID=68171 RepID=A0A918YPX2_9ACTN|nr:hypothetical protein [Streptomyces alanosinicus]GHE11514.1 hypothetical protein GCM10010339_71570 [Streptomyces alanosinicus]